MDVDYRATTIEPLKQRACVIAVDLNLLQHRERHAIVELAKLLDLVIAAGILAAELVAREAEDDELVGVLFGDALVDLLETLKLGGEAALGGRIDDKNDLALVIRKGDFRAALYLSG